jgi:hypothetical protein
VVDTHDGPEALGAERLEELQGYLTGVALEHEVPLSRHSSHVEGGQLLMVYFGAPNVFITLWFGFVYGTNC